MSKRERIIWIDQLRSIAFFFVILGHVALPKEWQSLIYSFHMPLFFMISGLTVNREKMTQIHLKEYILDQAQKLLVPYFWMQFLMFPLWYFAFHYITQSTELTIKQAFIGIFVGNNQILGAPSNALWFLLVLFLANILFVSLVKIAKGKEEILFVLILICSLIGYADRGIPQIWHFNIAFTAVVFMYIGNSFMKWYSNRGILLCGMTKIFAIVVCLCIGLISHELNGRISMTANKFGKSLLLFYITSICFSLIISLIAIQIPYIKSITYIGQNTLLYVGIHIPILRIFEKMFPSILMQPKYSVLFAIVLYFGIAPICMLFNRYAPYVCGRKLNKKSIAMEVIKVCLIAFGIMIPYFKIVKTVGLAQSVGTVILLMIVCSICITVLFNRFIPFVFYQKRRTEK